MPTAKQARVLQSIKKLMDELDHHPLIREIAQDLGSCDSTIHTHIQALIKKGYLLKGKGDRGYQPVDKFERTHLPFLGKIAAGLPIEAIPNQQNIDITHLLGADRYVLQITGHSMIDAGILDGDFVIIQKQAVAHPGDMIVALIQPDEVTLKYYYPHDTGVIELRPANQTMKALYYPADKIMIQGVVVGQFRDYLA